MGQVAPVDDAEPADDAAADAAPLHVRRGGDGDPVALSGRAVDLEELGQAATTAAAGSEAVDVAEVDVEQPDSGLWH